jgi:ribonuclease J
MLSLVRPKFFVPVHGEYRQLKAHANIAESLGIDKRNIIIPDLGNQIILNKQSIKLGDNVPSGIRLVDGLGVGDVGSTVLKDRIQLSEEGLCVVTLTISNMTGALTSKPNLITRGFVYIDDTDPLIEEAKDVVINAISSSNFKSQDWTEIKQNIKKLLGNYFYKKLKRRPLILPVIIEV